MNDQLVNDAVSAALRGDWEQAVKLNNTILKDAPNDIDCINRLGKAYLELGDHKKACTLFKKVLKINSFDPIATKNLAKAMAPTPRSVHLANKPSIIPVAFLEEPGKTKIISLVNVASSSILLSLNYATPVEITIKRHSLLVNDPAKRYLGALPDDLGHRLLVLMKGGNKYEAFVKSVSKNTIVIFVRETFRAKQFQSTPSFTSNGNDYLSYVREDSLAVHEPSEIEDQRPSSDDDEDDGTKDHRTNYSDEEPEE